MAEITRRDVILMIGERREGFVSLSGVDLSGLDLSNLSFNKVDFHKTNLSMAKLKDCNFIQSSFQKTNLRGANLENVEFENCQFSFCQFDDSNLYHARFIHCDLDGVSFIHAFLENGSFQKCGIVQNVTYRQAWLAQAFFGDINFEWNVKFTDANLMSAVFKDVVLGDTDFSSSIMDSINFINSKTNSSTKFSGAYASDLSKWPANLSIEKEGVITRDSERFSYKEWEERLEKAKPDWWKTNED
jgi:fluoroquinolone resistance protein